MNKATKDRNRGLGLMATTVERIWGHRCSITEPHCPTCHAWQVFDHLAALTNSDLLNVEDTFDNLKQTQKETSE